MKKILSLGIASALLASTAIFASAAVVQPTMTAATSSDAGVVTVTVAAAADVAVPADGQMTFGVKINVTDGTLKKENITPNGNLGNARVDVASDGKAALVTFTGGSTAISTNDVLFAFVVTPDEGKTAVSFNVVDSDDPTSVKVADTAVEVKAGGETSDTSSDTTSSDGETSGDTSTDDSNTSGEASKPGNDKDNPDTGIALAVVPAVLAGAAIVVAKKRK